MPTEAWFDRLNALCVRLGAQPGEDHLDVIERTAERLEGKTLASDAPSASGDTAA